MKKFLAILGSALMGLTLVVGANAANPDPVPVEVEWIAPITIATTIDLKFGLLDKDIVTGDTITIAPDDGVTESTPRVVGGTQTAASLTITATASKGITILADNPSNGTYYNLDSFMCNYAGAGSDSACDTGYGETSDVSGTATLLVGAKLTGITGAVAGTDDSTFDVTIVYQ